MIYEGVGGSNILQQQGRQTAGVRLGVQFSKYKVRGNE